LNQVQGYPRLGFFTVDLGFQNLRPPTDRGKQKTKYPYLKIFKIRNFLGKQYLTRLLESHGLIAGFLVSICR